jgi:pullulanase/glycogen debranching enzyme
MRLRDYFMVFALLISGLPNASAAEPLPVPAWGQSPAWTKDLLIYEIATKAFTSPNGPESGTFESLKARLPYLQELGVTGLWLTGHSLSDSKHFLNIWTQYACIEPDKIDPTLDTPKQFKALIDEAHRRGIKIFLDVITHGVMKYSPLVRQHPDWFLGESWGGMVEYDWIGGHLDLDDWWVKIWTDYVTQYGVDGFRLDLGTTRPDLWARIRQNAFAAGHPIVIFEEATTAIPGVTDFGQANNSVSDGKDYNELLLDVRAPGGVHVENRASIDGA